MMIMMTFNVYFFHEILLISVGNILCLGMKSLLNSSVNRITPTKSVSTQTKY